MHTYLVTPGLVVCNDSGRLKIGSSVILDWPEKGSINFNAIIIIIIQNSYPET